MTVEVEKTANSEKYKWNIQQWRSNYTPSIDEYVLQKPCRKNKDKYMWFRKNKCNTGYTMLTST